MKSIQIRHSKSKTRLEEFLAREDVQGNLYGWVFGEICQNQGLGFLTGLTVIRRIIVMKQSPKESQP